MSAEASAERTPAAGRRYWRGLEELDDSPEFRRYLEREFPEGAATGDGVSRRDFVRLMSASFLLAGFGLTGCRRPVETIVPFSRLPEGYVHGREQYFATAMPVRRGALPLLAKSADGRPVKLEGNGEHPLATKGTDAFAQAALLDLYDPDRSRKYLRNGTPVTEPEALSALDRLGRELTQRQGEGVRILARHSGSPTRQRLRAELERRWPQAKWHEYEPVGFDRPAAAAAAVFGTPLVPRYRWERAERILSLDCDFLGDEENAALNIKQFAGGRSVAQSGDSMNRLYAVEGLMTLTGSNADHRLRVPTGSVRAVAAALLVEALERIVSVQAASPDRIASLRRLAEQAAFDTAWVAEALGDLAAHRGRSLVVAGYRQPLEVHVLALALNQVLENVGKTVELVPDEQRPAGTISELKNELDAGAVDTLVILGGNPGYDAPAGLDWQATQRRAKRIVRLGYHEDETSGDVAWHVPQTHFLESWGDARTPDGTRVSVQPLIQPLFGGLSELEVIARLIQAGKADAHSLVRATFDAEVGGGEEAWKRFVHDGFLAGSASEPVADPLGFRWGQVFGEISSAASQAAPGSGALEAVFYRDAKMDDGRFNNNGWMQELPDPVTKLTWDNAALLSRLTARELGVENGDVVTLEANGRSITGPVLVQPGLADHTVGLAFGYGRSRTGRIGAFDGQTVGFDVNPLRPGEDGFTVAGVTAAKNGERQVLATTQAHWSMEGRAIVREANLEQFEAKPDFAAHMGLESHGGHLMHDEEGNPAPLYPHPYEERPSLESETHQWGMAIDLNRCVGCSACVVACQSENNVPIVGKEQVAMSREMHWLRIDRYYAGGTDARAGLSGLESDEDYQRQAWIDDPQVVSQPMLCQHCESAPCESVCPVNATVHDHEGLNVMVYNRCVGTRYCSNNCAWKVRRFNFFDYNKRPLERLYEGPLAERPADELELTSMVKNPDVSVRMRGVMEKCTFCVQRIETAKIRQKVTARDSGDIEVPDGAIQTACEQACPADAIVFGNLLGSTESRVKRQKANPRNYAVLGFLDTKPRTTYLAKVRNPNRKMPDYHELPLSTMEYSENMGNPFQDQPAGEGGHH